VTIVLGVLNVAAFGVTVITSPAGFGDNASSRLFGELDLVPIRVAVDGEYWRLLGAAFLHIGLLHLVVNMLALAVVGPSLERLFGAWRYLTLYLVAALGGSVSVYLFDSPISQVAGASGAIFGLFAATLIVLKNLGLDARFMLLAIAVNFAVSFTPGISLLGHLGGFIAGGLVALALVHAPKKSRTAVQILAVGVLLAIMLALILLRTDRLMGLVG
jgi:membrane associated rhomboid family serine protease